MVFGNKCLRRILRVYWPSIISNAQLWADPNQQPIAKEIRRHKWHIGQPPHNCTRQITTEISKLRLHRAHWNQLVAALCFREE